ncbi:MAG: hypothetical protein IKA82_00470 [Clostridia bacterium]|nr:hypothetical protein [Clostridia bacterium]
MKKQKVKIILHMPVCIVITFIFIYLTVFFGGWKLIESGDPILIEIAVSVIVGILLWIIYELSRYCEEKFDDLHKKIQELEKHIEELSQK